MALCGYLSRGRRNYSNSFNRVRSNKHPRHEEVLSPHRRCLIFFEQDANRTRQTPNRTKATLASNRGLPYHTAMINLFQEASIIETKSASPQPTSDDAPQHFLPPFLNKTTWRTSSKQTNSRIRRTRTRRSSTMMNIFRWSLFLLASHCVGGCTDVFNSYALLKNELDFAQDNGAGSIFLCPFTIEESECPEEPYVVTSPFLFVFCASFGGAAGDACVMNCPRTHFDIQSFAWLTLDSITLSGAVNVSTIVRQDGTFTASYSLFQNNTGVVGGGAVHVKPFGTFNSENSDFVNNAAPEGGAIYSQGTLNIRGGSFTKNRAQSRGGAIFASGSFTDISGVRFQSNVATVGPAVFALQTVNLISNEGCGNAENITNAECNGVASDTSSVCQNFETQCTLPPTVAPTAAPSTNPPTQLPTQSPTVVPTGLPTVSSTNSPTQQPTNRPSVLPSLLPTPTPTTALPTTTRPTQSPSRSPSAVPSRIPTAFPTQSHEPSGLPTSLPSQSPTRNPSASPFANPTAAPTQSRHPSPVPTPLPSQGPTEGPSVSPSGVPSTQPSQSKEPSESPTAITSVSPSTTVSKSPTQYPTFVPTTVVPSSEPSSVPSVQLTTVPTPRPTGTR